MGEESRAEGELTDDAVDEADEVDLDAVGEQFFVVEAELCRRSLKAFVQQAWSVVESAPLSWNWHLDLLCAELRPSRTVRPSTC